MSSNPSPAVAALLSFLFPGAGQVYAGEVRKGLIWAIPMFLFIIGVLWIVLGGQGTVLGLLRYQTLLAILVLNIAFFFYHVAAMLDAYAVAQRERSRGYGYAGGAPILLAALVSFTLILHGVPEVLGYQLTSSFCRIVTCGGAPPSDGGAIPPAPSFLPTTPRPATPTPIATPGLPTTTPPTSGTPGPSGSAQPPQSIPPRTPPPPVDLAQWPLWAQEDGRLNILVAGTDSRSDEGVDDDSLRTDTMLLLSVDIQAGKAAMFSFPRNLCTASDGSCGLGSRYPEWLELPLSPEALTPGGQAQFPNGTYGGLGAGYDYLNALWRYAAQHPEIFSGSDGIGGGLSAPIRLRTRLARADRHDPADDRPEDRRHRGREPEGLRGSGRQPAGDVPTYRPSGDPAQQRRPVLRRRMAGRAGGGP